MSDELDLEAARPRTRGDCARGPRPCPWISCRYHLVTLEVGGAGELIVERRRLLRKMTHAEVERATDELADQVAAMPTTCALDVIARNPDGATLEQIGEILGVTRERVRQIERKAMRRMPRRVRRFLGSSAAEPSSSAPAGPPPRTITTEIDE